MTEQRLNTSAADIWADLPQAFRTTASGLGRDAWQDVYAGITPAEREWRAVRPFFMDRDHFEELGRVSDRLAHLVLLSCRRRARSAGELHDLLAGPVRGVSLLDRDAPLSEDLLAAGRPDVLYRDGIPLFVELNIGGALGATPEVDLIASRFHQAYSGAQGTDGVLLSTPPSPVKGRFDCIRSTLGAGDGDRVAIPVWEGHGAAGHAATRAAIEELALLCDGGRAAGLDTFAVPLDEVETDDAAVLHVAGRRIDAVLWLYVPSAQPDSPGMDALARASAAGTLRMHTPEATFLLTNKKTLGWLWEDLEHFEPQDAELIRRHVPRTRILAAHGPASDRLLADALRRQHELVLKPGGEYSGHGVVVGPAVTAEVWRRQLDRARADGGHVLQEYVEGDLAELDFVNTRNGEHRTAAVPYLLGPHLFDHRPCGMLVRHGVPDGDASVLSLSNGALLGSALLVERGRPAGIRS
ncbi:hypothetical protein EF910_00140 [Streptomyces sp. WAC07149]|uniref:hypothetical protein n=1 Tax=Streptomyces sp. WAC07149 TaxID=2487425 RepID=UPI000F7B7108|nr:hypothetical protein [Streptomyces sp. WAC07149]RST08699.1 hypothetical protein EF910_00140 [Streptomyces sp. WAC07149]